MQLPSAFKMLINGQMASPSEGSTFDVINPATEECLAKCPIITQEQTEDCVQATNKAFLKWQKTHMDERKKCLEKLDTVIKDNVDELARLITLEQGKPLASAKGEVLGCCWLIDNALKIDITPEVYSETDSRRIEVRKKPIGVVACITAWNFPFFLALQKICPALVLGNTVIYKPSPYTPLSNLRLGELIQRIFPPGVFNIITDATEGSFNAGAYLSNHPKISKVSFTGSGPTGKAIMKACAGDVKRFNLELGGNDPAIVRQDVDVKETAKKVFAAAFGNSGQVCVAVKRVLCHESILDEFTQEMVNLANAAKFGNGLDEGVEYGPLCNYMQLKKVIEFVEDAKAKGATIHCGGKKADGKGYFYAPTIVTGVSEGTKLWDEEQFGPVLPIASFKDDDEAVERANASIYGLGGSVWSKDVEKANEMAANVLSGTVWVNQHTDITGAPFGGFKQSGIGRELGKADVQAFTELQTLSLAK